MGISFSRGGEYARGDFDSLVWHSSQCESRSRARRDKCRSHFFTAGNFELAGTSLSQMGEIIEISFSLGRAKSNGFFCRRVGARPRGDEECIELYLFSATTFVSRTQGSALSAAVFRARFFFRVSVGVGPLSCGFRARGTNRRASRVDSRQRAEVALACGVRCAVAHSASSRGPLV